jgi:hypothetical protein
MLGKPYKDLTSVTTLLCSGSKQRRPTANQKRGPSRFIAAAATHRYPMWRQTCCQDDGGRESLFYTPWHARAPISKQPPLTLDAHTFPAPSKPHLSCYPPGPILRYFLLSPPGFSPIPGTDSHCCCVPVSCFICWITYRRSVRFFKRSSALGRPIVQARLVASPVGLGRVNAASWLQHGRNGTSNPNSYK